MASSNNILSEMSDSSDDITPIRPYRAGTKGRLVARKPKSTKDHSPVEGPKDGDGSSPLPPSEVVVLDTKPSPAVSKWWETAGIEDIDATKEPTTPLNKVNKKKKNGQLPTEKLTRCVAINGFSPPNLNLDKLRVMAGRIGIVKAGKMSKRECLEALAEVKLNPDLQKEIRKKAAEEKNAVNQKRYINVLYSDAVRPMLQTRGESLTPKQLTDGLKKDELLHLLIVAEYNDRSKHNDDACPHLRHCKGSDPSKCDGPIDYDQSVKVFKSLTSDYETALNNWRLSGNHGDFEDESGNSNRIPFVNFVSNKNILLYLHELVYEHQDTLSNLTGELPATAFSESTNPDDDLAIDIAKESAKKKSSSTTASRRSSSSRTNNRDEHWEEFNSLKKSEGDVTKFGIFVETRKTCLRGEIRECKNRKRKLIKDRSEYKEFKEGKVSKELGDITSSQESVYNEAQELEGTIIQSEKELAEINQSIKKLQGESVDEEL